MTHGYHTPALCDEVLHYLQTAPDGIYIDGTLGGGGHTESIVKTLSSHGRVVAFDKDEDAIHFAEKRLEDFRDRIIIVHDNFSHMKSQILRLGLENVDGILLDLGVSSFQVDEASRGFSFQRESKLDMRMDQNQKLDAWTVINSYEQGELADVFWKYGEERHSRRIARAIVGERNRTPIETTRDLSTIVERVVGGKAPQKSLARVFQAIRIEVNRELDSLREGLRSAVDLLRPGGRLIVIAYHSLEDRIIKDFFKEESRTTLPSGTKYLPDQPVQPRLRLLTRKPVTASQEEVAGNSRARSAKLRAAERV